MKQTNDILYKKELLPEVPELTENLNPVIMKYLQSELQAWDIEKIKNNPIALQAICLPNANILQNFWANPPCFAYKFLNDETFEKFKINQQIWFTKQNPDEEEVLSKTKVQIIMPEHNGITIEKQLELANNFDELSFVKRLDGSYVFANDLIKMSCFTSISATESELEDLKSKFKANHIIKVDLSSILRKFMNLSHYQQDKNFSTVWNNILYCKNIDPNYYYAKGFSFRNVMRLNYTGNNKVDNWNPIMPFGPLFRKVYGKYFENEIRIICYQLNWMNETIEQSKLSSLKVQIDKHDWEEINF